MDLLLVVTPGICSVEPFELLAKSLRLGGLVLFLVCLLKDCVIMSLLLIRLSIDLASSDFEFRFVSRKSLPGIPLITSIAISVSPDSKTLLNDLEALVRLKLSFEEILLKLLSTDVFVW